MSLLFYIILHTHTHTHIYIYKIIVISKFMQIVRFISILEPFTSFKIGLFKAVYLFSILKTMNVFLLIFTFEAI